MARRGTIFCLCLTVACLGGCTIPLDAGADRVMVVTSDAAVSGAKLIDSESGSIGNNWAHNLSTMAKNFGSSRKADMVLMQMNRGVSQTSYTFEAWKRDTH